MHMKRVADPRNEIRRSGARPGMVIGEQTIPYAGVLVPKTTRTS